MKYSLTHSVREKSKENIGRMRSEATRKRHSRHKLGFSQKQYLTLLIIALIRIEPVAAFHPPVSVKMNLLDTPELNSFASTSRKQLVTMQSNSAADFGLKWDDVYENGETMGPFSFQYSSKHPEAVAAAATFTSTLKTREKMIVFDKDGTLADCTDSLRRWAHHMTEKIQGILITDAQESRSIIEKFHARIGWDASANDVVPSAPLAAGTWEDQVTSVYQFLVEHQDKHHQGSTITRDQAQIWHDELGTLHGQDSPIVEDLRSLIITCRNLGYKIAICTSDDRPSTDVAMRAWNIQDVVDVSICGNEVSKGKPSAEPLYMICQRISETTSMQCLPQDCIVVGDTTSDTGMARNAQAGFCVGVLTGSGTTEQLLESGAHLILPHVGHLPALLQNFEKFVVEKKDPQ